MTDTTRIIYDALFATLRREHFGSSEALPIMSPWKWRRVEALLADIARVEPYTPASTYHFQGSWQERRRERIWVGERHNIDTSTETLELLNILVYNVSHMEREGVAVCGLIAFGRYLRERGHLVDYVKLDTWLRRLHIEGITSALTSLLTEAFAFSDDEFPFPHKSYPHALRRLCRQLDTPERRHFSWRRTRMLMRYSPTTLASYIEQRTKKALNSIEE